MLTKFEVRMAACQLLYCICQLYYMYDLGGDFGL